MMLTDTPHADHLDYYSEQTPEGYKAQKLGQTLLNGNNITMLLPGGTGPEL